MQNESERRKDGWTLWREVYGTIIGAATVLAPILLFGIAYINKQVERVDMHDTKIIAIERVDAMREASRVERNSELDKRFLRYEIQQDRIESKLDRAIERK